MSYDGTSSEGFPLAYFNMGSKDKQEDPQKREEISRNMTFK
jgi:hypothetical protein